MQEIKTVTTAGQAFRTATIDANELTDTYTSATGGHASNVVLDVLQLTMRFGGIVALDGVSFQVQQNTICGLIGPNGAGKTTCFNCLSGLYRPTSGSILFLGQDLVSLPKYRIAEMGIGRTFQNLALFSNMSVRENIMVGGHSATKSGFLANAFRVPGVAQEEKQLEKAVDRLLDELLLREVGEQRVDTLPFGTRKRVELARALAGNPKLLILDEPAAGLNHEEVEQLGRVIQRIRDVHKITVLLVEHHMNLVMTVSDKIVVLDFGKKIADGLPLDIQQHPDVMRAYLGGLQ